MKLEHLYYFYEISKYGSYTEAAEKLYITQQALSRIIKALETELSVQLFERTSTGIRLTIYGEILFNFVDKNYSEYKNMLDNFQIINERNQNDAILQNDLIVLTNPIFISTLFPPLIRNLQRTHPATRITLHETNTPSLCNFIAEHQPDSQKTIFGFGNLPYLNQQIPNNILSDSISQKIIRQPLTLGRFCAYVSKSSPLAKYKTLSMQKLLQYPVIMYAPDSKPDPTTEFFLRAYGNPNMAFFANNIGIMNQYISMNFGIGYLVTIDEASISHDTKFDNLVRIQIAEDSRIICSLFYHKNLSSDHPFIQSFLASIPFKLPE